MDNEIRVLVNKCLDFYSISTNIVEYIDRDEVISLVLSKKHKYNPNHSAKNSFNNYFSTLTKRYMSLLYKKEEERIKLVMKREDKLNQILN